jgi:hypothetical protein
LANLGDGFPAACARLPCNLDGLWVPHSPTKAYCWQVSEQCPICATPSVQGHSGDARQVRCPRCGPYTITLTARAMLGDRLEASPTAPARLSYAIRHRTSESDWLSINSANLDELASTRLPIPSVQRLNLLNWMAEEVEDDRLGTVRPPHSAQLAAVVGATNGDRVQDLFRHAMSDGYIEPTGEGGYRITPKGWDELDRDQRVEPPAQPATYPQSGANDVVQAVCPVCGPRRRAEIIAAHTERQPPDDLVYEATTLNLLRCCGCNTLFVRRDVVFSENEEQEQDPVTGEWVRILRPTTTYWPERERRSRPAWFADVADETVRRLLDETYTALNANLLTLAAMGVRAVLDRVFELAGADAGAGFEEKLRSLREQEMIGAREHDILQVMTDAGSAAAHRGWRPEPEQLETILDSAEAILHRVAVMMDRAARLRESVPPRPRRPIRGRWGEGSTDTRG